MQGNRYIIVSKIYVYFTRIYQGAGKLTQKLKYQNLKYTCEHIRFGKKPHKLTTVTGWEKIRSGRYHNDNIFKNIHGQQQKSE